MTKQSGGALMQLLVQTRPFSENLYLTSNPQHVRSKIPYMSDYLQGFTLLNPRGYKEHMLHPKLVESYSDHEETVTHLNGRKVKPRTVITEKPILDKTDIERYRQEKPLKEFPSIDYNELICEARNSDGDIWEDEPIIEADSITYYQWETNNNNMHPSVEKRYYQWMDRHRIID